MEGLKTVNGTGTTNVVSKHKFRKRRSELFNDILLFQSIDDHAIQVAISDHKSFRDLIEHLVIDQDFKTELEKTRAIFRWVTARDLYCLKYEKEEPGSPEDIFAKFRGHKTTYAKIFETMCRYVGLKCAVVTGFAKGRTYRPGDPCGTRDCRHSWNAVSIDGAWYLVDTKWAARRSSNGGGVTNGLVMDCDDFYFLTDPEKFIYSHWSNSADWQLLENPVTFTEFEKMPHLKPNFFKCGLHTLTDKRCVLETTTGSVNLRIGCSNPTKFCYRFLRLGKYNVDDERKLGKYVFQVSEQKHTSFNIRIPRAGLFFFKVYAKQVNKTSNYKNHLTEVASYKIVADGSTQEVDAFPPCASSSWGASPLLSLFGLEASKQSAKIETQNGKIHIEFQKTRPVEILCKLRYHPPVEDDKINVSEIFYIDKVKVSANLPAPGEYGMDIYCRDPDVNEKCFTHICQYLLIYTKNALPSVDEESQEEAEADSDRTTPTPDYPDEEEREQTEKATISDKDLNIGITQTPFQFKDFNIEERTRGQVVDTAPDDFRLTPTEKEVGENGPLTKLDSSEKPALRLIYGDAFEKVDDHALEVAKCRHASLRDLLWDLVYSKDITDELLKIRALFRWLVSKKVHEMTFDSGEEGGPEEVMNLLQRGKSSYADVFDVLCRYAGLQSRVIPGVTKGLDYRPGQKSDVGLAPHSWNAVFLRNAWCLFDPCLASHPIVSTFTASGEFHFVLDEHYFLTEPNQLVYTHFPDDPKWELLDELVSRDEFLNFPQMTPHFFAFGLDLLTHKHGTVVSTGDVDILLKYSVDLVGLRFSFTIHADTGHEDYQGTKLNKYGMMESKDGVASFRFRLPEPGTYIVYIYAKDESQNNNKENVFAQVCEYIIHQDGVAQKEPVPFPPCPYLSWGPRASFFTMGLATAQNAGTVHTKDGKIEFRIEMQTLTQFRTRLAHHSMSETDLEGYVIYKILGKTAIFNFTSPGRGEYGLEIYAKGTQTDDKKLYHVAQYLIVCDEDIESFTLPKLPPGFLGPQPQFVELGLSTLSHHDPIIHSDQNRIEIILRTSQDMRFTGNMIETETRHEYPEHIFIQTQGTVVTFVINIPTVGFYMLRLHGIPAKDPSHQVPAVYNYLINCKTVIKPAFPFPKQFGHWKEGGYMWKPMELHKEIGTPVVPFRVYIPKAKEVAVVVDQDWTLLKSTDPGVWEGTVELERYYGRGCRLTMVANYGGDVTRYATLLEYTL